MRHLYRQLQIQRGNKGIAMIKIKLNGAVVEADAGAAVIEVARREGLSIPSLCYHEALGPYGACRLCIVEAEGPTLRRSLTTSCNLKVFEGLTIETETPLVKTSRRVLFELLLAKSPDSKPLTEMAKKFGVTSTRFSTGKHGGCVQCGLCVRACQNAIGVSAITFSGRGQKRHVATAFNRLSEACIGCGACANVCPTGSIKLQDRDGERKLFIRENVISTFELVRCRSCGTAYATRKFLDHAAAKSNTADYSETKDKFCSSCARKKYAEGYSEIVSMLGRHL